MKTQDVCKHCGVPIISSGRITMHSVPNVGERRYQYKYCMLTFAEFGVHSVSIESSKTGDDRCGQEETLP